MHINQDNYEQYFLDHAEGNLSPGLERELADFLDANPDLKSVLDGFDPSPIQTEEIRNEILRDRLKKNIHPTKHIGEDNTDEWLISEVEGLLNEEEKKELQAFLLKNPAYIFDQKYYKLTRMTADPSVTFRRKDELKKKIALLPVSRLAWSFYAVAAIIILLIGIRFFQKPEVNDGFPVKVPEIAAVAETPETNASAIETNVAAKEMQANMAPSSVIPITVTPSHDQVAEFTRPQPLRMEPIGDQVIISSNPPGTEGFLLAVFDLPPAPVAEKKEKPLIAKVFTNLIDRARDGIDSKVNLEKANKPDFSLWSIAQAGIQGYNSITDRELELYIRKDEEGKVKSYALVDQDRLLWSKNLEKP
jgi:hypothetical protein